MGATKVDGQIDCLRWNILAELLGFELKYVRIIDGRCQDASAQQG